LESWTLGKKGWTKKVEQKKRKEKKAGGGTAKIHEGRARTTRGKVGRNGSLAIECSGEGGGHKTVDP